VLLLVTMCVTPDSRGSEANLRSRTRTATEHNMAAVRAAQGLLMMAHLLHVLIAIVM
jgi:hypothetical protein